MSAQEMPDPDDTDLPIERRLEGLIERIKKEQAELETLEANFVQNKQSLLLLEPEQSEGRFWYHAQDRVRWDFRAAEDGDEIQTTVVIRESSMLTWFRDLGRAERVDIGRQADRIMEYLSASNSLETLQSYFRLRATFPTEPGAPYVLKLEPSFPRVAKRIQSMTLHVDREGYFPVFLEYVDPDDDVTQLSFRDTLINRGIDDEIFDIELPADVEVQKVDLRGRR